MTAGERSPGTFVLSFDCEGKFGVADHLSPRLRELLRNETNNGAYRAILTELERRKLKATFAFVGAFTLHPDEYALWRNDFGEELVGGRLWLQEFFEDATQGRFDGWLNPRALELVREAGGHEVGTHGFTHLPLSAEITSPAVFDREMVGATRVARQKGYQVRTIVYPRNQIGHVARLSTHGLIGYREALHAHWDGASRRLGNVLTEFNLFARSQRGPDRAGLPVAVASGHILNFQHNLARRLVPRSVTIARWKSQLDHAARTGGVVHLWSHPHNFLTDPGLADTFGKILDHAVALIGQGTLRNATMEECARGGSRL